MRRVGLQLGSAALAAATSQITRWVVLHSNHHLTVNLDHPPFIALLGIGLLSFCALVLLPHPLLCVATGLMLGGGLSNYWESLHSGVVDYFRAPDKIGMLVAGHHHYLFNAADLALTVGLLLWMAVSLRRTLVTLDGIQRGSIRTIRQIRSTFIGRAKVTLRPAAPPEAG